MVQQRYRSHSYVKSIFHNRLSNLSPIAIVSHKTFVNRLRTVTHEPDNPTFRQPMTQNNSLGSCLALCVLRSIPLTLLHKDNSISNPFTIYITHSLHQTWNCQITCMPWQQITVNMSSLSKTFPVWCPKNSTRTNQEQRKPMLPYDFNLQPTSDESRNT